MGFDPITMAATISKLAASGQIGTKKEALKLTFDGDITDKETIELHGFTFAKISDTAVDFADVTQVGLYSSEDGEAFFPPSAETIVLQEFDEGSYGKYQIFVTPDNETIFAYSFHNHTALGTAMNGVYVLAMDEFYTSALIVGETIKPIDPKYLPVNAINITDYGMGTVFSYVQQALAAGGYYKAPSEVSGFWEKIDEITQSEYNTITLYDNDGTTMRADPMVMLGVTNNLSVNQAITYIPEIGYVQVKGNINRSAVQNVATISVWATILSA